MGRNRLLFYRLGVGYDNKWAAATLLGSFLDSPHYLSTFRCH